MVSGGSRRGEERVVTRDARGGRSKWAAVVCCLLTVLSVVALAAVGAEWALADRASIVAADSWQTRTNAALVARFYVEVWNNGGATAADFFVADDHAYHDPTAAAVPPGPAGVAQVVAELRRVFPDLVLTLDDVVATGDRVAVRFTARGTHRGTWLGAEGTGRVVALTGIAVHRIVDGQIGETWVSWDALDLAMQVGLVVVPVAALGGADGWEGASSPEQRGRPS
jgi:steroid delta-isomerase-like uncharacterized protein